MLDLVRTGHVQGLFRKRGDRMECWVSRESLHRWTAKRDEGFALYMPRPEAMRVLGLANSTILSVAKAGLIRYTDGFEQHLDHGVYFLREDVMRIKAAFDRYRTRIGPQSKSGKSLPPCRAINQYMGQGSALLSAIQAVVDGALVPIAYRPQRPGIMAYLFRSADLSRYKPMPSAEAEKHPEGFVNYKEAAARLGVASVVVRGLVACGILSSPRKAPKGSEKLVPVDQVRRFSNCYVGGRVLCNQFNASFGRVRSRIESAQIPHLAVPIPRHLPAVFVERHVAARLRISGERGSWNRNEPRSAQLPICRPANTNRP
jgi:hypothetical protein